MQRKYEVMFILRPDIEAEEADKLIAGFATTIEKGNGKVVSSEKLGNRKLAYTVRKFNDGSYNLLTVEAEGDLVAELERRMRVTEPVIKFITVRIDEEEKRVAKLRKLRSMRVKQSDVEAEAARAEAARAEAARVEAESSASSAPQTESAEAPSGATEGSSAQPSAGEATAPPQAVS